MHPFVPRDFEIPETLETARYRLRMLSINDLVKDYDAVMSSVGRLKQVFGPDTEWPTGLTLEQDLVDLGWHQGEFQRRRSFAYTVMNPDESQCLGCVYVSPTPKRGHDAVVHLWVRDSEFESGLDATLFADVERWIASAWPFKHVAYPGRTTSWASWSVLEEE